MKTILLFDEIGAMGITPEMIARELEIANGEDIEIRINSGGGDVFDGISIFNFLKNYNGNITIIVDGIAASIASIIAMAGDELIMNEGSFLMVHNPWGGMMGESQDFRKQADLLDGIRDQLLGIYERATDLDRGQIQAMMDSETWLNADQAIEMGFATSKQESIKVVANLDKTKYIFNNIPMELKKMKTEQEIIHNEVAEKIEAGDIVLDETPLDEVKAAMEEPTAEDEIQDEELEVETEEMVEVEELAMEPEEEEKALYTESDLEEAVSAALAAENKRRDEIKALSFPGQEDLVDQLIIENVSIDNAMKRLIVNAKELKSNFTPKEDSSGGLLEKLQNSAPKSLDSKEGEVKTIESLRLQLKNETNEQKRIGLRREINKLKK